MDELERRPAMMKLKLQLIIESDSGQTEVVHEVTKKLERCSLRPETQRSSFLVTSCTTSVWPESDSMMSCNFSFIIAGLLSSSSIPARLRHIAEGDDLLCAGQSDAA